ncbi:hypothetical protein ACROYT_G018813 [Oculina patagonica]
MAMTSESPTLHSNSLWSVNGSNATPLDENNCKPYPSDTNITNGVKIFSYCVLLLLSVLGNSVLIAIIKKNKRMQTITNHLIANMAVSDILITVLVVPRKITEILLGPRRWLIDGPLGSFLCKTASFFQDISTAVSILSLVAIAIDRYRGIVFPLRKQLIKPAKLCKVIIPLIWITSMGLHAVYFYIFRLVTKDTKTYCTPSWAPKFDDRKSQETYYLILLVFLIIIPTCVVTILYSAIILNLKKSRIARLNDPSSFFTSRRLREDTKVVRIIIAILIAFIVCIIPINVFAILMFFVWSPGQVPCGIGHVGFAVHFILYSNASVNPLIYFILNDKYRKGLLNILKALHIVKSRVEVEKKSTELATLVERRN